MMWEQHTIQTQNVKQRATQPQQQKANTDTPTYHQASIVCPVLGEISISQYFQHFWVFASLAGRVIDHHDRRVAKQLFGSTPAYKMTSSVPFVASKLVSGCISSVSRKKLIMTDPTVASS